MAKKWAEVAQSPEYQALPYEDKEGARTQYFHDVVAPQVPAEEQDAAWSQFDSDSRPSRQQDLAIPPQAGAPQQLTTPERPPSIMKMVESKLSPQKQTAGEFLGGVGESSKETARAITGSGMAAIGEVGQIYQAFAKVFGLPEGVVSNDVYKDMTGAGKELYGEAMNRKQELKEAASDDPVLSFGHDVLSVVLDMAPALAAGWISKNPNLTLQLMGGQAGTQTYAGRREEGENPAEAIKASVYTGGVEALTELIPIKFLFGKGKPWMEKVLGMTLGEGAQEGVSSLLQSAYDKGTIKPEMTLNEAAQAAGYESLVGMAAGTVIGGTVATGEAIGNKVGKKGQLGKALDEDVQGTLSDPEGQVLDALDPNQGQPAASQTPQAPKGERRVLADPEAMKTAVPDTGLAKGQPVKRMYPTGTLQDARAEKLAKAAERTREEDYDKALDQKTDETVQSADIATKEQELIAAEPTALANAFKKAKQDASRRQAPVEEDSGSPDELLDTEKSDLDTRKKLSEAAHKRKGLSPGTDNVRIAVAKLGGIAKEDADSSDIDNNTNYPGIGTVVRQKAGEGNVLGHLAEILADEGYPVVGEDGTPDGNMLAELIRTGGETVYTDAGMEAVADKEAVERELDQYYEQYDRGEVPQEEATPPAVIKSIAEAEKVLEPWDFDDIQKKVGERLPVDTPVAEYDQAVAIALQEAVNALEGERNASRENIEASEREGASEKEKELALMEEIARKEFIDEGLPFEDFVVNMTGRYADTFPNLVYVGGGRNFNVPVVRKLLSEKGFKSKGSLKEWWDSLTERVDRRQGRRATKKELRTGKQRRRNWTYRKSVEAMSPNEKDAVIKQLRQDALVNKLTGMKGRDAWEEDALPQALADKHHIVSIDADSLGWVNDNIGAKAGDKLLVEVGNALKEQLGEDVYHVSGDEFWTHGANKADLTKKLKAAQRALKKASFEDAGSKVEGMAFSYGITKDAVSADRAMKKDKAAREKAGDRVAKTERPKGVTLKGETPKRKPFQVRKKSKNVGVYTVFHGQPNTKRFSEFSPEKGKSFGGFNNIGSWFVKDKKQAIQFAKHIDSAGKQVDGNIYQADISLKNPWELEGDDGWKEMIRVFEFKTGKPVNEAGKKEVNLFREYLRNSGKDGIIIKNLSTDTLGDADKLQDYYLVLDSRNISISQGKKKVEPVDELSFSEAKSKEEIAGVLARYKGKANPQIEQALDELEAATFNLDQPAGEITTEAEKQTDIFTKGATDQDATLMEVAERFNVRTEGLFGEALRTKVIAGINLYNKLNGKSRDWIADNFSKNELVKMSEALGLTKSGSKADLGTWLGRWVESINEKPVFRGDTPAAAIKKIDEIGCKR